MALHFCSFASGSSGNCYMVKSETTTILIDVGIAGKKVLAGLEEHQLDITDVDGVLITHEHIDHVRSLQMISKKATNAQVCATVGTLEKVMDKVKGNSIWTVYYEEEFSIGDILIKPFRLSHDAAEPAGYSLIHDGKQVTIVTDTGCISPEIFAQIEQADLLVLEANHEVNILQMGAYPYPLKRRILGDHGHLSNETAAQCICRLLKSCDGKKTPSVILAHLSRENNTPKQAYLTIRNMLFEEDYYINKDVKLGIVYRDELSPLMEV
ncbi:phosphoribosyl 1,2-cyclic phosphodiesterase [Clostridiales Family XIII bacterium PM5-7]